MLQNFFEKINALRTTCIAFSTVTSSFDNISHSIILNDVLPEDDFFIRRPVARALLVLRKLVNKVNLMIQSLRIENRTFEAVLNSQIRDITLNNTLILVSQHHSGWNEFMQCQKFIIISVRPLLIYHQIALDIEQHVDIVRMYCNILTEFLNEAYVLNAISWHMTDNSALLNIAEIIHYDCVRIFAQTELHYADQIKIKHNIAVIAREFYCNRGFR